MAAAGTDEANAVAAKMRELPVSDAILDSATVREDGRVMRPFYLFEVRRRRSPASPTTTTS